MKQKVTSAKRNSNSKIDFISEKIKKKLDEIIKKKEERPLIS